MFHKRSYAHDCGLHAIRPIFAFRNPFQTSLKGKPDVKDVSFAACSRGCHPWRTILNKSSGDPYFAEQDLVSQWVEECCNLGPRQSDTVTSLFKSWTDFAVANGEKPSTTKWFNQTLGRLGCVPVKNTPGNNGKRGFRGISVKLVAAHDRTEPHRFDGIPD
jgi:hypothetical protein